VRTDKVAVTCHRSETGNGSARGVSEVIDDHDARQPRAKCGEEFGRTGYDFADPAQALRCGPGISDGAAVLTEYDDARPPRGVAMQEHDAVDRRACISHNHRIRQRAQGCSHPSLVSRFDGQQRGHGADDAHRLPRLQQGAGAIATSERDAQGLESSGERSALPLALALLMAQGLHKRVGVGQSRLRVFVLGVKPELARIESGDLGFQCRELALGGGRARAGILPLRGHALDLGGPRLAPRARNCDAPREAGETFATIRLRADPEGDTTLLFGERPLRFGARGRGLGQRRSICFHLAPERELLLAQPGRLGLECLGVASALGGVFDLGADESQSLGSERCGAEEALAQRGQAEPRLLRRCQERCRGLGLGVEQGLLRRERSKSSLDLEAPLAHGRLVRYLGGQGLAELSEVVGHEAQASITGLGLDHHRASGDLGLAPQGLQLPPELGREIRDPREVALHGIELAEGLLLALTVLEDARGLLDEATTVLGGGVQDRIELPLPHDDVHLATDAGIGQELLDVEESARGAVDGVFGTAVAEESARDGDLGVVDG